MFCHHCVSWWFNVFFFKICLINSHNNLFSFTPCCDCLPSLFIVFKIYKNCPCLSILSPSFNSINSSLTCPNWISINLLNGFKKWLCPQHEFPKSFYGFWKDFTRYTQFDGISFLSAILHTVSASFFSSSKIWAELDGINGIIQKRQLTQALTIKCFRAAPELMRTLLITHWRKAQLLLFIRSPQGLTRVTEPNDII